MITYKFTGDPNFQTSPKLGSSFFSFCGNHLLQRISGGVKVAWAMAGRDIAKLEALRNTLPQAKLV